jgi:tetratricopeptide (TPR) repeat protein
VLLAEGKAIEAVGEFRAGDQAPDGPVSSCAICLYANLAQAFDRANLADSAIIYYERYVTTPMLNRLFQDPQYLAGTLKRLGELYEAKGDRQKAASVYTRFVELWKDADPELQPKVAEVRRRLQILSRTEPAR